MASANRAVLVCRLLSGCHGARSSYQIAGLASTASGTGNSTLLSSAQLLLCGYHSYASSSSPPQDYLRPPLSPAVRHLVESHSIKDLSSVIGTGPRNRLLKGDILQYIQDIKHGKVAQSSNPLVQPIQTASLPPKRKPPSSKPLTSSLYTDLPLDDGQVANAMRLTQYKTTVPHTYASISCKVDRVLEMNQTCGWSDSEFTAFLVKAAALALQRVPQSNVVWTDSGIKSLPSVNISVLLPQGGCVILQSADRLNLETISKLVEDGSDSSGGGSVRNCCLSLRHMNTSNIAEFASIIHPHQSSALSVGPVQAVPNEQGSPSICVNATLTADARVMDYEHSCIWLDAFCRILEAPDSNGLL